MSGLLRDDAGVMLITVSNNREPAEAGEETPGKLALAVAAVDDAGPGDALLVDWVGDYTSPGDTLESWLFIGLGITGSTTGGGGGVDNGGDTGMPSNTVAMASFGNAGLELRASLALRVPATSSYVATEQAMTSRTSIQDYYVARGLPVAHAQLGVDAIAEVGSGELDVTTGWPAPADVVLGSTYRWLPTDASWTVTEWGSTVGALDLTGVSALTPALDTALGYIRGDLLVEGAAMVHTTEEGGRGYQAGSLSWDHITLFLVAVLRPPEGEHYVLLASSDDDGTDHPELPYLEVRYHGDGRIETYARTQLASFQSTTGIARSGQPIIVGLSLDASTGIVTTVACDRNPAFAQTRLVGTHPTSPVVLSLGDTPVREDAAASMDVLDFAVWTHTMDTEEMAAVVSTLDGIYGVTQS